MKKIIIWSAFTSLSIIAAITCFWLFPKVFPIINLELKMDRNQALQSAQKLATNLKLEPSGDNAHYAVQFQTDDSFKTFIELEKGVEQFNEIIKKDIYQPYQWEVRIFQEGNPQEAYIRFTPEGNPYEFEQQLSEEHPGPDISEQEALEIVSKNIQNPWNIQLSDYTLVETSKEIMESGRSHYTFVYERKDITIAGAQFRLQISVDGNELTEIVHSPKIPESFTRRYQQMRSTNDTIAETASFIMHIFFIILGCGFGIIFLLRKHYLLIFWPFIFALIISSLLFLHYLNQIPFSWFSYSTAVNKTTFLIEYIFKSFYEFFYNLGLCTVIIAVAEGLTRFTFGNQPQFWKSFSFKKIPSLGIIGRTIAGYLIVPFDMLFIIIFYLFTTRYLGWWNPAEVLSDPNILATKAPWLSAIAMSLEAGVIEESVFRAIPLSIAELLGKRFNKKILFRTLGFIIQALVFSAAHANYPAQPAYARILELIPSSLFFGYLFIRYGLLIVIIMHTVIDIVWFSVPIFASESPGSWQSQLIVLLLASLPLLFILVNFLRFRKTTKETPINKEFVPIKKSFIKKTEEPITYTSVSPLAKYIIIAVIILSSCTIPFCKWSADTPKMVTTQQDAIKIAHDFLEKEKISLDSSWQTSVSTVAKLDSSDNLKFQHLFIWRHAPAMYHPLLSSFYLQPPVWIVRIFRTTGTQEERIQEYQLLIGPEGSVVRYYQQVPENKPGATLEQTQAQSIVEKFIESFLKLSPKTLNLICVTPTKEENRTDWIFTFHNTNFSLPTGSQARVSISFAGQELKDFQRFIYPPEVWQRQEMNNQQMRMLTTRVCTFILYLLLIITLAYSFFSITMRKKQIIVTGLLFVFLLFLFILDQFNKLQDLIINFNTSQPFNDQLLRTFINLVPSILLSTTVLSALFYVGINRIYSFIKSDFWSYIIGFSLGIIAFLVTQISNTLFAFVLPTWATYDALSRAFPFIYILSNALGTYISLTCVMLALVFLCSLFTPLITYFLLFILGFILVGSQNLHTFSFWMVESLLLSLVFIFAYWIAIAKDRSLILLSTASFTACILLSRGIQQPFDYALVFYSLASLFILLLGLIAHRFIKKWS